MSDHGLFSHARTMGVLWPRLIIAGVLDVVIGVLALAWPGVTVLALALLLGIVLLVSGISAFAFARTSPWSVVFGIVSILAAIICIAHPGAGVFAILFGAALWFLLTGFTDLTVAFAASSGRLYWGVLGTLSIIGGVIMLASPGIALVTVALVVGVAFVVRGVMELGLGWRMRGSTRSAA